MDDEKLTIEGANAVIATLNKSRRWFAVAISIEMVVVAWGLFSVAYDIGYPWSKVMVLSFGITGLALSAHNYGRVTSLIYHMESIRDFMAGGIVITKGNG